MNWVGGAALWFFGLSWIGGTRAGSGAPPVRPPDASNQRLIDKFTWGHFLIGALLRKNEVSPQTSFVLSLLWELGENEIKARHPGVFPWSSFDSVGNSIMDTVGWTTGYHLMDKALGVA